jgi:hypothetical protein
MPTPSSGKRRCESFIDVFVDSTANLGAPKIFRKWTAISLIAATLEQKVWLRTSRPLHPNIYVFLIAAPGVGKTRTIMEGKRLAMELEDFYLAPVSMTFASLVDALCKSKRTIVRQPEGELVYNTMWVAADELGAFIHKYEPEMIDGLSHFYDPTPYQQVRRTNDIDIQINSPQINILAGSTPQNLMGFMPDKAWGQGFSSRVIMVFSDERIIVDDFGDFGPSRTADLVHDLKIINGLYGEFTVTEEYKAAVGYWRAQGEPPVPGHPKLIHYTTRRRVHIYKLSMIASITKSSAMILTEADFLQALEWLVQAETFMEDIFKAGTTNADAAAMDEIQHFVVINDLGTGVSEQRIVHFARERVPLTSILRIIEIMEGSGQIFVRRRDRKTQARYYSASPLAAPIDAPEVKPTLKIMQ